MPHSLCRSWVWVPASSQPSGDPLRCCLQIPWLTKWQRKKPTKLSSFSKIWPSPPLLILLWTVECGACDHCWDLAMSLELIPQFQSTSLLIIDKHMPVWGQLRYPLWFFLFSTSCGRRRPTTQPFLPDTSLQLAITFSCEWERKTNVLFLSSGEKVHSYVFTEGCEELDEGTAVGFPGRSSAGGQAVSAWLMVWTPASLKWATGKARQVWTYDCWRQSTVDSKREDLFSSGSLQPSRLCQWKSLSRVWLFVTP